MGGRRSGKRKKKGYKKEGGGRGAEYTTGGNRGRERGKRKMRNDDILEIVKKINNKKLNNKNILKNGIVKLE